ncbi:putative paralog of HpaA [Helicobacter heilmannii]|uniref:HpaA family protein n=1 Tax=Helicobacter heilmannii TaxID=35817 RepID=UPI0006A00777|nr:HpaA family protein [Helicobacter heilmannii]CRF50713.1 putative paralog of HpaA [Helicobacter heilmannii]
MRKVAKGFLWAGVSVAFVISGCAISEVSQANSSSSSGSNKVKKHVLPKKGEGLTPLDFNYPISAQQEPSNGRTIALLDPHIQVSGNLQPYLDQFQDALVRQIQDIFQRMGYQVVHVTNAKALAPEQKHKIWSVLDIGGWVGILEDIKMNTDNPKSTNMDVMVDQSSGSVWFKLYEPETGRIVHNFGVEVGTEQAITKTYTYQTTNSGGFEGADITSHSGLDKNNDDAIRRITNSMYVIVMKKLVSELTDDKLNQFKDAIEQIKKTGH